MLNALLRLDGAEPPGLAVAVGLLPGDAVAVGVMPAVDVGVGDGGIWVGVGEGVGVIPAVAVGVTGTGVCPTGVGPPAPPTVALGVAPGAVGCAV